MDRAGTAISADLEDVKPQPLLRGALPRKGVTVSSLQLRPRIATQIRSWMCWNFQSVEGRKGVPCQKKLASTRKPVSPWRSRRGQSIAAWAKDNGVPRSTAFRWASDPKVRRDAEATRRPALGRAIRRLSGLAMKAVDGIVTLAEGSGSESVQLRAWCAVLADHMAVAKFSDLEYRMTEIEEQIGKRT